jgi:lysozyme family protein
MGGSQFDKRTFLKAAGALAVLGTGARAAAQDLRVFGLEIPGELAALLPAKPLEYVRLAEAIITLEREADGKRLPPSDLPGKTGSPIAALDDAIYQVVLPRLVMLIDRSEAVDPGLADKAGGLLAQLHQTQHELPEALRLNGLSLDTGRRDLWQRAAFQAGPAVPDGPPTIPMVSAEVVQPLDQPARAPRPQTDADAPDDEGAAAPLSRARTYALLREEYRRMFASITVRPERAEAVDFHLAMIRKSRPRYEGAAERARVPWFFIAVTHALEASFNFRAHLHNGDFPLSARTRQVPAGRPRVWLPPSDWESSAVDAINLLGFGGQDDWSVERTLYRLEAYNGFGYRRIGVPTPYLWSFSQHYDRGKFVADGKFSLAARSQQCGAAVMLARLAATGEIDWEGARAS